MNLDDIINSMTPEVMKSKQQLKEDFGISAKPIAMFK